MLYVYCSGFRFLLQLFLAVLLMFWDILLLLCAFLPSYTCIKVTGTTQIQQTAIFIATHIRNIHKWLKLLYLFLDKLFKNVCDNC